MNQPNAEHDDSRYTLAWEFVDSEPGDTYRMFRTRSDRVRSPRDGSEHRFDIVESADAVTVLASTPAGELVMVEQFRHGTREAVLEFPGGVLDAGDDPIAAAVRELREETGYAGRDAEWIGKLALNPSWQTTYIHVVRLWDAAPSGRKELDEAEDTRVRLLPLDEALRWVCQGTLNSAVAVAALAVFIWQASHTPPGHGR